MVVVVAAVVIVVAMVVVAALVVAVATVVVVNVILVRPEQKVRKQKVHLAWIYDFLGAYS